MGAGWGIPAGNAQEVNPSELYDIMQRVRSGESLRAVLEADYKHATISIIRGLDRFDYTRYTQGAYFSRDEAEDARSRIKPNGTPGLCDLYGIIQATPAMLAFGMVRDCFGFNNLDSHDAEMVFEELEERLK